MNGCITATELDDILALYWDQIVYWAHGWYLQSGRGALALEKIADLDGPPPSLRLMYAAYDTQRGKPSPAVAVMIREYDPDWEIIVQYVTELGEVRTVRLMTGDGYRHPRRVHLLETMMARDMGKSFSADFWAKMGMLDIEILQ